jgi:hypothetical protein
MVPVAIFAFLVGSVLAWRFRVWVLVPVSLLAAMIGAMLEMAYGHGFVSAVGQALLFGMLPQLGYGFGLIGRHTLVLLRTPSAPRSRTAAIALLYRQRPGR